MLDNQNLPTDNNDTGSRASTMKMSFAYQESYSIPVNREVKNRDLIEWGDDDKYPNFLIDLYKQSSIHGAIVQGKTDYIVAEGLQSDNKTVTNWMKEVNSAGDGLDDIFYRCVFDYEMYGAFMLNILWTAGSNKKKPKIAEIYHLPVEKFRYNITQEKIRYSREWSQYYTPKTIDYPVFDLSNPTGNQIFHYIAPTSKNIYGESPYESAIEDINTDRGIKKYHGNLVRNGFAASLILSFFDGTPSADEMKDNNRNIKDKFLGANGETFMVTYSEPDTKAPVVIPIQTADNDKFIRLMQSTTQNIFSAHRVSTPSLFGLQTNAQKVGTTNEFEIGYEVFQKTYVRPRQRQLLKVFNKIVGINFNNPDITIKPMVPVTIPFTDDKVKASCMYPSEMRALMQDWNFIKDANNKPEGESFIGNRDQPNLDLDSLANAKKAYPGLILPAGFDGVESGEIDDNTVKDESADEQNSDNQPTQ